MMGGGGVQQGSNSRTDVDRIAEDVDALRL